MLTVFISYAREDQPVVARLEQALQSHGIQIWRDEHNLRGGERWPSAIAEAIEACDAMLLVWSQHTVDSGPVESEWTQAAASGKLVVPWVLDASEMPPAFNGVHQIRVGKLDDAVDRILAALRVPVIGEKPRRENVEWLSKRWLIWAVAVVAVLVAVTIFVVLPPQQKLEGVVRDVNGKPLSGVKVRLNDLDLETLTNSDGQFVFWVRQEQRQVDLLATKSDYRDYNIHPFLGDTSLEIEMMRKAP